MNSMKAKLYVNHKHVTHELIVAPVEEDEGPLGCWSVRIKGEKEPLGFWEPIHTESLEELIQDAFELAESELNEREKPGP